MRELKFRFVDKGDGTVYKPITLAELCQRIEIPRRIVLESENGDFVDAADFLDQIEKGELIADQYTGIKDKNNKEIYEGDIIREKWYDSEAYRGRDRIGKVEYFCDGFNCWFRGSVVGLGMFPTKNIEVIGNIHENPELLECKK